MRSETEDGKKSSPLEEETSSTEDEDASSPENNGTPSSEADNISNYGEEYQPVPDSSSSGGEDNTDTAVEGEQLMAEWMSHDGKMMLLPVLKRPCATIQCPGPTLYTVVHISSLGSAFDLFITEEMV